MTARAAGFSFNKMQIQLLEKFGPNRFRRIADDEV